MKILLTGGGTGGHITPLLAVAHEIKKIDSSIRVIYVGERGGKFPELINESSKDIDEIYSIFAGKFRRYYGESWITRALDIKTNMQNLIDLFRIFIGIIQAWIMLGRIKPNVVFQKGGFVGVPVSLAAAIRKIPIVTHDSDALPGLANQLVSKWASLHATALPANYYSYDNSKTVQVGVLVEHNYQKITSKIQSDYKHKLGIKNDEILMVVTGGSSGAENINNAMVSNVLTLLDDNPNLKIIHQVGKGKLHTYNNIQHDRLQLLEFLSPMYMFLGAADIVICRTSANTIAELGIQAKPVITIPSEYLAGGHQIKNAKILEEQGAAIVIYEDKLYDLQQGLSAKINSLLRNKELRNTLSKKLESMSISGSANKLANILTGLNNK